MILSEPLESLRTFFMTSLIKLYHNSQRMSVSYYHITECITHLAMLVSHVLDICVGIHRYSTLTYDVIKSYLCETKKKMVMARLYWKQALLCD